MQHFLFAALAPLLVAVPDSVADGRGVVIEDFESGSIVLDSYPGQDQDPSDWEIITGGAYGGTRALRFYGNTWKTQDISPITLSDSTVWQVAAHVERLGEMQAFGIADSLNELLYTFAGSQLPVETKWWTVYQGAFPLDEWYAYLLPLGRDWFTTHGYYPTITKLIYVNDDDSGGSGAIRFDEIVDVTEDLPVPPEASILYTIESSKRLGKNLFLVGIQFYSNVFDPDSDVHTFAWDFGDGEASADENPLHEFLVSADYTYTVGLSVRDPDALVGGDTCQVQVDPGSSDLPLTMNFVGDVFTGRGYENNGGIIDTYGVEALFEPTRPIFGDAADVNVANLECSYTDRGTPHPTKSVVFRSRPENIAGIEYAGVDVVTLGNNHIVDYGEEGMLQTIHLLDSLGIEHSGAGTNSYFALLPTFYTEKGVRIAFLGQCNRDGRSWNYQPFLDAGLNKPGFGYFIEPNITRAIPAAAGLADIVVAQFHSGDEYDPAPPEKAFYAAPPVEASTIGPGDPDFRFRVEPTPGDRALRRLAADLGADIVINHHPHVLQGFEVHNGKLIAHSLGNFVFDLYYPETMPTMVLNLEVDKEGIVGYSFAPAWIDDWIPQPAVGRLGREILDRVADYSRPMNALVAVYPDSSFARVYLDRSHTDSTVTPGAAIDSLVEEGGYWLSPPMELAGAGNLSKILSVAGAGSGWEIRPGREILWHGVFEEEGATFWDDNTDDEWFDSTVYRSGKRSLALRRDDGNSGAVGTDLEKHLVTDSEKEHSAVGWQKGDNAKNARMMARFYNSRYSESPVSSEDIGADLSGNSDWERRWANLSTPSNGTYFEVRCSNDPPSSGTGHAWFDDVAFVEWEPWAPADGPVGIPSPNNFRFVQVRSAGAGPSAVTVNYEETSYRSVSTEVTGGPPSYDDRRLRNFPNPFNPRTTVELSLPKGDPVDVTIDVFDVRGRRVASLFRGELPGGATSGVAWDGKDDEGRPAPSGIYFARAKIAGAVLNRKMVLIR